jgi:hypothetical protein
MLRIRYICLKDTIVTEVRLEKKLMPHNFFWKRACIEARDHGEPSRAVKSAERRNGINVRGPRER